MIFKSFFRKFTSPIVWGNLLAMAVVLALLMFGLIRWIDSYTHHGEAITVPDLSGLSYDESIRRGYDLRLVVMVGDSTYNKAVPAGCVVAQRPEAGASVKEGRIVYVTINSLTMPRIAIPDLVDNSSYRPAQARLQAMGFKLTEPKLIDGHKDWVYGLQCGGRNVDAGDMVAKEATLTLIIGNGMSEDDMEEETKTLEEDLFIYDGSEDENEADAVDPFLEIIDE